MKALDEFHVRSNRPDGRASQCRSCKKETDASRYRRHKKKHREHVNAQRRRLHREHSAWAYRYLLRHPCVDCGERDPVVLEFDHVRGEKRCDVSNMLTGSYSLKSIKAEIAKCDVRCANCHRRKTAEENGWLIFALEAQKDVASAS